MRCQSAVIVHWQVLLEAAFAQVDTTLKYFDRYGDIHEGSNNGDIEGPESGSIKGRVAAIRDDRWQEWYNEEQ
ncbi:hypothetical protein V8B97DRAFT_843230 [Scleroderma yunnanense]